MNKDSIGGVMQIENKTIKPNEKDLLEKIFSKKFQYREEIINQINNAEIERTYTDFYLSLKFKIGSEIPPVKTDIRVPVEMRIYKENQVPVQVFLHIVHGYVSEVEVFNADSSKIIGGINFKNIKKIEILINPSLIL